ncbi:MAG: carbohydrate binding family 9 domain-containing protein [Gemmatimonadetes bacterium]|nr:carbohydrate binding family 9 domain-containing protein [Gemmatimonadota bacterium]
MIENRYGAGRDLVIAALLTLSVPVGIAAQSDLRGSEVATPSATAPRTPAAERAALDADAPLLSIVVDGVLDDAEWANARVFTHFTQTQPVEGAPVEYDTEVRMIIGDEAIWIAARMHDPEPESIVRRLTRRDSHGAFDLFAVTLDPNLDGLTGYMFGVSAANVQSDSYLYDDDKLDPAWDAVWSSAVTVDAEGWTVELRIPLSQIRYEASDAEQTWGVNFYRSRVSSNEQSYYSLVSRLKKGRVSQMGRMEGVRVTRPSRRLEILPYVVSNLHNGPSIEGDPFFDGLAANGRFGMDVSYGLGSAFTLDATINPDFGQVEADPAVINLSAFETFFDERRPFFVEDARVFDFNLSGGRNQLFYSRRVGRSPHGRAPSDAEYDDIPSNSTILGAAKLSGRTANGLSVGVLAAVTGNEFGQALFEDGSRDDFLVEPRSEFGVVSLAQDLNDGATSFAAIATGMRRALPIDGSFDWLPSSAFSGGARFEHQWDDRTWGIWGVLGVSQVRGSERAITRIQTAPNHYFQRPDATRFQVDETATSMAGVNWRVQLDKRGGRHWTGGLWAAEVTNGFEINDLGFSTTAERLDGGARISYREIQPGSLFRNYSVTAMTFHNWSHEALDDTWSVASWQRARMRGSFRLNTNWQFLNYWNVRLNSSYSPQSMTRSATRGGPMMVNPASTDFSINVSSDRRKSVSFGSNFQVKDDRIGTGGSTSVRGDVRFQPADNLSVSVSPNWSRSTTDAQYVSSTSILTYDPTYGRRYLFAELDRRSFSMVTRVDWTFTPTLSLQLYAQPLLSSGDYLEYKQLARAESYDFFGFEAGSAETLEDGIRCTSNICNVDGKQYVDFDGDGTTDYSFTDRDFNVRSLVGNTVLRWEYRPGSTIFLVWQRQQFSSVPIGDFDLSRDAGALFGAPADNRFIIKMNYWLGL